MTSDKGYRASHMGRGWDYHDSFVTDRRMALLWAREQQILTDLLRRHCPAPRTYLDFACGTGRVTGFVAGLTSAHSTGVDVAESMLEVARLGNPGVRFVCADLTSGDPPEMGPFDLITAFQFFPNAEQSLREAAIAALKELLAPGGVIILNNHQNASALRYRMVRMRGRFPERVTATGDLERLVADAGLEVVEVAVAGVLPQSGRALQPARVWRHVDRSLARLDSCADLATDHVLVVRA